MTQFTDGDICLFVSTTEWDLESALIRRGTNCAWSHTGWYRKSTKQTFSAMADGKGLAWRPVKSGQTVFLLDEPHAADALALALPFAGTPYDYWDIAGIVLGKNWSRPNRLICDVTVFKFYEQLGFPLVNPRYIPRIHMTPRDVLLALSITSI